MGTHQTSAHGAIALAIALVFALPLGILAGGASIREHQPIPVSFWSVVLAGQSPQETYAAHTLAKALGAACGVEIPVTEPGNPRRAALIVGGGEARSSSRSVKDRETFVMHSKGAGTSAPSITLTGVDPTGPGTLYAVNEYLEMIGFRFYTRFFNVTPECTPDAMPYTIPDNKTVTPTFYMRSSYKEEVMEKDAYFWAAMLRNNYPALPAIFGGGIDYLANMMVHTAARLLPREKYGKAHPEWFWPRVPDENAQGYGQLCWHHQDLVEELTKNVMAILDDIGQPPSELRGIISVSQNDNHDVCLEEEEVAINESQGSNATTLLRAVNAVAREVGQKYPNVLVDTLAYQFTQKAPNDTKPEPNVVIRLCSIEANFAEALSGPSNVAFMRDLRDWSALAIGGRLHIWDYTTDFYGYFQPYPNMGILGENLRIFAQHNVVSVLEEDIYNTKGGFMGDLRAWLLAKLMWNPMEADAEALTWEFLEAFYGSPAAIHVSEYMKVFERSAAATGDYVTFASPVNSKYLSPEAVLAGAQAAFAAARAPGTTEDQKRRARALQLGPLYVWLCRHEEMRKAIPSDRWPWSDDVGTAFDDFASSWNATGAHCLDENCHGMSWLHDQVFNGKGCV